MTDQPTDQPTALDRILADIAEATAEAAALTEQSEQAGTTIAVRSGEVPAEAQKRVLAGVRGNLIAKTAQIKALREQARAEMDRQMQAVYAALAPMEKQVKQFTEAIQTVNLYLGAAEEIYTLAEGEPAPADVPLTIRQQVLSMDEETAMAADTGGIDFRDLDVFDAWVVQPEHLDQVLPERKGVVALVPRRRGRTYGDPWLDSTAHTENLWTYFLIRNGDNVYRLRTEYVAGKTLIPTSEEFTALFQSRRYDPETGAYEVVELRPGTHEWDKAMEKQGARQRHYMRAAMILQGLVDRTAVFAPIHPGGIDLLNDATYALGRARLVRDAESALTDGRPLFKDWLADLTRHLRPGMRVLGAFNTKAFKDAGGEGGGDVYDHAYSGNDRITPNLRYDTPRPESGVIYRLEGRKKIGGQQGLFFYFEQPERWIGGYRGELRRPEKRGTCTILPGDTFVVPYDLVDADTLLYYLRSRTNRASYEEMMPVLQAALTALEEEAAAEEPVRALIAAELVKAHGVDPEAALVAAPDLVDWWKTANQWYRPLSDSEDPEAQAKAIAATVAEYGARRDARPADAAEEARVVALLLDRDPTIMVIGRKHDGTYLAFAPHVRAYPDVPTDLWAVEYTTGITGRSIKTREWVLPSVRLAKARILHTTETWERWNKTSNANTDLTDPEILDLAQQARQQVLDRVTNESPAETWSGAADSHHSATSVLVLGVTYDAKNLTFTVWALPEDPDDLPAPTAGGKWVPFEYLRIHAKATKVHATATLNGFGRWNTDRGHSPFRGKQDYTQPWGPIHDGTSRNPRLVFADADVQAEAVRRATAAADYTSEVRALNAKVNTAERIIRDAWTAAFLATAKAKFIEDYLDEGLWEDHAKTVRVTYPYESSGSTFVAHRGSPKVVHDALVLLVDRGADLTGLTVSDVVTQAGGDAALVPDDLADLPVTAPAKEKP